MSLIPTVYNSTDPGAPQLTGLVGILTALLDAVLVDGYGVGADAKAPAGWSREFTAPNIRVYRGNPITGTGYRLRVDDSAAIGNARHAWTRGFESMSAADVGVNPVPTVAQFANGVLLPKSTTLSTVARRWRVVANELFIYVFIDTASTGRMFPWFAGDAISYKPGDMHCFVISNSYVNSWAGDNVSCNGLLAAVGEWISNVTVDTAGLFVARSHTGTVGALRAAHFSVVRDIVYGGNGGAAYPSAVNAGLLHAPASFITSSYVPRGELPGFVGVLQLLDFADGTVLEGVDGFEGEQLLACRITKYLNVSSSATTSFGSPLLRLGKEWHQ